MKGDSGKWERFRWDGWELQDELDEPRLHSVFILTILGVFPVVYVQCLRSLVVFGVKLEACILHKESTTLFLYNTLSRTNTFQYLLSHTMEVEEAKCWKVELTAGMIHSSIVEIVTFLYCVSPSYNCWPIEIHWTSLLQVYLSMEWQLICKRSGV